MTEKSKKVSKQMYVKKFITTFKLNVTFDKDKYDILNPEGTNILGKPIFISNSKTARIKKPTSVLSV